MKKRLLFTILVGILACAIILPTFLACSSTPSTSSVPSTNPATTKPPVPTTPAAAKPAEVIKLKFAVYTPPNSTNTSECQQIADSMNQLSNGRLEVTVFAGETLGKSADTLDMLKNGIAQLAVLATNNWPNRFPMSSGIELPFLVPNAAVQLKVKNELFAKGYLTGFDDLHLLKFQIPRPMCLWFRDKQILKAEDFTGLKIRVPDSNWVKPFEQFGVTAVNLQSGEVYSALERKIVDGTSQTPENAVAAKYYEVVKYGLLNPITYGGGPIVMDKATWDKLSPDLQAIVNQAAQDADKKAQAMFDQLDQQSSQQLKDHGVTLYQLDATEYSRWQQLASTVVDQWTAKTDAQGLKGTELIKQVRSIINSSK